MEKLKKPTRRKKTMSVLLMTNSLGREMRIEGFEVRAKGGARLETMMDEVEGEEGTVVFLFGIPDIRERGSGFVRERVVKLEE